MPLVIDKLEWLQGELIKAGNLAQPYYIGRLVNADIRGEALKRTGM